MKKPFILIFVGLMGLAGCRQKVDIAELVNSPDHFHEQSVITCGRVIRSVNIFVAKGYILEDGGDQLLVLSDKSVPVEGADECVSGIFSQAVKIPGFELHVLDARERRKRR